MIKAKNYIIFDVDSKNGNHEVTNIGFEQKHGNVTRYFATYWLETIPSPTTTTTNSAPCFNQLQYTQTMLMDIPIKGVTVSFPHVTTNTLTKKV